jgi:DNA-binding NtrC family response regulator
MKGRILIVDDLPDVRVTLAGILLDEGQDVRSASSRVEALQMLETEPFHVALLDVRLDESDEHNRDGLLPMHQIKQKDPNAVVIIMSGHVDVRTVQEALQPNAEGISPAFAVLQKAKADQFLEYVTRAFEHVARTSAEN